MFHTHPLAKAEYLRLAPLNGLCVLEDLRAGDAGPCSK